MYNPINRPWTVSERSELIRLWPLVPSNALIAIEMNRSISSVQSQANRIGLPRRNNKTEKTYARWTHCESVKLEQSLATHTDAEKKIHIVKIADEVNRSIDTVISKLIEIFGSEKEVLSRCHAPLDLKLGQKQKAKFFDDRESAKPRKCLTCQRQFWSEGAYNRICAPCKEANQEIESTEHSFVW